MALMNSVLSVSRLDAWNFGVLEGMVKSPEDIDVPKTLYRW